MLTHWIPTRKKLPPQNKKVLIQTVMGNITDGTFVSDEYGWDAGLGDWSFDCDEVEAWAKMPKKYKKPKRVLMEMHIKPENWTVRNADKEEEQ